MKQRFEDEDEVLVAKEKALGAMNVGSIQST